MKWRWFFKTQYEVYTDGSYKQGRGAWAFVIAKKGRVLQEGSGRVKKTTSNHMEIQAAIEAIKSLPPQSKMRIYTDSRVLITTATELIPQWKTQNWKKKKGQPIPHEDLVKILDAAMTDHHITWQWIKAHSGIALNERCDELCTLARG